MEKKQLLLTIVTPEKTVIADRPVEAVTIPAFGGEMGVLPGHASFVVQLMEGILHYRDGHHKEVFAVLNGFAEIHKDKVMVLAESAELSKEVDEERARQAYQKARETLAVAPGDLDLDEANAALRRAAAGIELGPLGRYAVLNIPQALLTACLGIEQRGELITGGKGLDIPVGVKGFNLFVEVMSGDK